MTRMNRAFVSALIVSALLVPAGSALALDENSVVGTWAIDFAAMQLALEATYGPEYTASADDTIMNNDVTMVLNADFTGTRTQTLSGNTEVVGATWSVSNIDGANCDITIIDAEGGTTTTWTFVDDDTVNWTEVGLPTPVIMKRVP